MTWIKLDDGFADHPKVGRLSDAAFRLHVAAMCYAGRFETDGRIPSSAPMVAGKRRQVVELTKAGLWDQGIEGFEIHDWVLYNPTRAELAHKREETALRVAKFRSNQRGKQRVTEHASNTSPDPDPARPVVRSNDLNSGPPGELAAYSQAFSAYEQATGFTLDASRQKSLMAVVDQHPVSWVVKAIAKAQAKGIAARRLWAYAAAIIEGWEETGFDPDSESPRARQTATDPKQAELMAAHDLEVAAANLAATTGRFRE